VLVSILSWPAGADIFDARTTQNAPAMAQAKAQLAWRFPLPIGITTNVDSYKLLDGVVYAKGSDGRIRAIDAATGRFLWSASVAPGGQTAWGPATYSQDGKSQVVFTNFSDAVFLDAHDGREIRRVDLPVAPTAAAIAVDEWLLCPGTGKQVWAVRISDGFSPDQVGGRGPVHMEPLYLPSQDVFMFGDDAGYVHAADLQRLRLFTTRVSGQPTGWLTSDRDAVYVTTTNDVSAVNALSRTNGNPLREPYRLNGPPKGGPVVTKSSVYQSLAGGGVHRISLSPQSKSWFAPDARDFVAEWPGKTVLLRKDGRLEFVETATGRSLDTLYPGVSFRYAVSNPANDLAIVATDDGDVWGFRPAGAGLVDTAAFHSATTQPTTRPVHTRPAKQDSTFYSYAPAGGAKPAGTPPGGRPPGAPPPPPPGRAGKTPPAGNQSGTGGSTRSRITNQLNNALKGRGGY
jgi:outer membrane protein assembly factor BamB